MDRRPPGAARRHIRPPLPLAAGLSPWTGDDRRCSRCPTTPTATRPRRADPSRRPRRSGAPGRFAVRGARLAAAADAARSGAVGGADRPAGVAGRHAGRVPPGAVGTRRVGRHGARRGQRPVQHRPAHRGGRAPPHVSPRCAAHVPPGPRLGFVAHERVAARRARRCRRACWTCWRSRSSCSRGSRSTAWPTYTDEGIDAPAPEVPPAQAFRPAAVRAAATRVDDDTVTSAVRQLVEPWTASSDGHAEVACVEGDADDAVAALGVPGRTAGTTVGRSTRWRGWRGQAPAAAHTDGGAAAALGRFGAWWLAAALCDADRRLARSRPTSSAG